MYKLNLYAGLLILLVSSRLLWAGHPFVKTWYYCLAWWSVILILDSANFRRFGRSPMSQSPRVFFRTAFLSIGIWLIFELFNLRLQNWSYHDLPLDIPSRWLGYSLAFATVVPALKELALLFTGPGGETGGSGEAAWRPSVRLCCLVSGLGAGLLILAAVAPTLFFPLVWVGFVPLLEPWNARASGPSLWLELRRGGRKKLRGWLLAGLTAGIFWEGLNFWAGSHWEYHLPYLDFWRVFQMPVFGYGGFLPFALEVFVLTAWLDRMQERIGRFPRARWMAPFLGLALYGLIFHLMDIFTLVR